MAQKKLKKLSLGQLLDFIPDDQKMVVQVNAYGIPAANTYNDGMHTAAEIRDGAVADVLLGQVLEIRLTDDFETKSLDLPPMLWVCVEVTI